MKPECFKNRLYYGIFLPVIAVSGFVIDSPYYLQVLTFIGINTLLTIGLNMLMGYAGQISLGHAAFYGIGAYTTTILTVHFDFSPWAALPCTLVVTGMVAFLVGLPMLKLTGYYLGMGTLGFGMIVYVLFREWSHVTGGSSGMVGIPSLSLGPVSFSDSRNYFYLVWMIVLVCIVFCQRLIQSRVGRALRSISDSENAAKALGVDTKDLKLKIFILSALFAAMAGFLYAHLVTFISPGSFDFMVSIRMVTMVVIGGMASIWGALLGASVLTLLPECLHAFADFEMVVYGLILMLIMIFMPRGLTRGLMDIYERSVSKQI